MNGDLVAEEVNGVKTFHHNDHLGSTSVLTDESGNVIERTQYDPMGNIIANGTASRYNYESKEYSDVTGDTDFHFRQYKSEYGFFAQPDTLIPNVYDPQQLNRYMFERGNPYKYTDETGHSATEYAFKMVFIEIVALVSIYVIGQWFMASSMETIDSTVPPDDFEKLIRDTGEQIKKADELKKFADTTQSPIHNEEHRSSTDILIGTIYFASNPYSQMNTMLNNQANQQKSVVPASNTIKVSKKTNRAFKRRHRSTQEWDNSLSQITKDLGISTEMEEYIRSHRYDD